MKSILSITASALLPIAASGAISLAAFARAKIGFSSAVTLGQSDQASCSASLFINAAGSVSDWAYGSAQVPTITASGHAVQGIGCVAAALVEPLAAAGALSQSDPASAAITWSLAASGNAGAQDGASAQIPILLFSSAGIAGAEDVASGVGTIPLAAAAQASALYPASAEGGINFSASGSIDLSQFSVGVGGFDLGGHAFAFQGSGTPASGGGVIPPIFAAGAIITFAQGVSREVWFDRDDRTIYWPPGEVLIERGQQPSTKAVVSWT